MLILLSIVYGYFDTTMSEVSSDDEDGDMQNLKCYYMDLYIKCLLTLAREQQPKSFLSQNPRVLELERTLVQGFHFIEDQIGPCKSQLLLNAYYVPRIVT